MFNYFDIIEVNAQKAVNSIPPFFFYSSLLLPQGTTQTDEQRQAASQQHEVIWPMLRGRELRLKLFMPTKAFMIQEVAD